jgi:rRNA processing protein Krr1/Pno1
MHDVELEDIGTIAAQILEQKALCQQDPDQEEDEVTETEDQAEYDSVLISSAGDVVSAMAATLGADFQQALATFLPLVAKYYVSYEAI